MKINAAAKTRASLLSRIPASEHDACEALDNKGLKVKVINSVLPNLVIPDSAKETYLDGVMATMQVKGDDDQSGVSGYALVSNSGIPVGMSEEQAMAMKAYSGGA